MPSPVARDPDRGVRQAQSCAAEPKSRLEDACGLQDVESRDKEQYTLTETARVIDGAAERRLCFKFDVRLLPMLAVMYLFNAIDKGNLGNAQTNGLGRDLGLGDGQYNLVVSVFFVPYVVFAPPLAMLAKRFGPQRALPAMMLGFGSMTLLAAATRPLGGLVAVRWFLGMAESAFLPTVIYYLTMFYRRGELARRLAVFYAASNVAGGFSGLLAFAVFRVRAALEPWRCLFLIEGAATVLLAAAAYCHLPRSAATARFLDERERALALRRVRVDSSAVVGEKLLLRDALRVLAAPTSYAFLAAEACLGVPLQSVALFLPQIVERLGHSPVRTNLYTVAPNATGAVVLLVLAFCSDLTRLRFPFIVLAFALTLTGFAVYACLDVAARPAVAYFATFLMCWGTSAPSVLLSTWYSNNIAHEGRRLTLTSIGVPLANLMGLVASNVFRERDAPRYQPALITAAGFGAAGALVTAGLGAYMVLDNRRRNRRAGVRTDARDVPTHRLRDGPSTAEFRWFL